jgi:hypothetical protein
VASGKEEVTISMAVDIGVGLESGGVVVDMGVIVASVGITEGVTAGSELMLIEKARDALTPRLSLTFRLKTYTAAPVGMPEMTPVPGSRLKPKGKISLDIFQTKGGVPLVASKV